MDVDLFVPRGFVHPWLDQEIEIGLDQKKKKKNENVCTSADSLEKIFMLNAYPHVHVRLLEVAYLF